MVYRRKTWQEKLRDREDFPKILKLEKNFPCYNAAHKMGAEEGDPVVLANPGEVVELMKKVPEGKLTTITEICRNIAVNHGVKACCSLTTGIFIMIAAKAAVEALSQGKDLEIPYWRTLKSEGFLNEKYPGGSLSQKELLEKEGFEVARKGKRFQVVNYRDFLGT